MSDESVRLRDESRALVVAGCFISDGLGRQCRSMYSVVWSSPKHTPIKNSRQPEVRDLGWRRQGTRRWAITPWVPPEVTVTGPGAGTSSDWRGTDSVKRVLAVTPDLELRNQEALTALARPKRGLCRRRFSAVMVPASLKSVALGLLARPSVRAELSLFFDSRRCSGYRSERQSKEGQVGE